MLALKLMVDFKIQMQRLLQWLNLNFILGKATFVIFSELELDYGVMYSCVLIMTLVNATRLCSCSMPCDLLKQTNMVLGLKNIYCSVS